MALQVGAGGVAATVQGEPRVQPSPIILQNATMVSDVVPPHNVVHNPQNDTTMFADSSWYMLKVVSS
jgi:hypothetical protein